MRPALILASLVAVLALSAAPAQASHGCSGGGDPYAFPGVSGLRVAGTTCSTGRTIARRIQRYWAKKCPNGTGCHPAGSGLPKKVSVKGGFHCRYRWHYIDGYSRPERGPGYYSTLCRRGGSHRATITMYLGS